MKVKRLFQFAGCVSTVMLLVLLAACGGAADESVEDIGDTDTGAVEDSAESDEITDDSPSATGSEEDSGGLPPTPDTGSKVSATRVVPPLAAAEVADMTSATPPANRISSDIPSPAPEIDVVLLLDATGSMKAEISELKAGLDGIAANLATLPGQPNFHYGLVLYRHQNKGDSTQLFHLTDSWGIFADNLLEVTAVGGGDYPEDLTGGLHEAVVNINWRPEAAKLLILLGDAPPHLTDSAAALDAPLSETLSLAAQSSITIFAIGSDGLDEQGTAVFQHIAQSRNGRFSFLSTTPENVPIASTDVYPMANLPTLLADIVAEVLNETSP